MRIAIVDDDRDFGRQVELTVRQFFDGRRKHAVIRRYCSAVDLCGAVKTSGGFDLYLADVEMPEMDGLKLAENLRELVPDVKLVFITSYEKYAFRSFKLGAYYYILKSEYEEELPSLLDRFCREEEENAREYLLRSGGSVRRIRVKDIRCLTKDGKYTILHCPGGQISERISLNEMIGRLPRNKFIFIGRGTIVNMDHVTNIRGHTIEVTGEKQLQISRHYYAEAMRTLTDYLGMRG